MSVAVASVGLLILALGMLGLFRPPALIGLVDGVWRASAGLWVVTAVRTAFGVLLLAAAAGTRFPWIVGALGVLSLASAVAIPVLGHARMRRWIDGWVTRSAGFVRAWSLVACAFGAFLVYAVA